MFKKFITKPNPGTMLINILVGIGILAVLATLSIPYFRKFESNLQLSSAARDLVTDLRYAQQLTVSEQVLHIVHLDDTNNSYQILKIDSATTTIKSASLPEEVSFQSINDLSGNNIYFNSFGGVKESGSIVLVNTNSLTKTINIKPSGYVQLKD